ncbi:hypothetical protein [Burkholderia gladioli]|nr:hypothetical protein [Burkholderia gladioli]
MNEYEQHNSTPPEKQALSWKSKSFITVREFKKMADTASARNARSA